MRPSLQRILVFFGIVFETLSSSKPERKHLEIAGGVGISLTPFKRQLMAAYGHLWAIPAREVPPQDGRGSCAGSNFLQALATLPLAVMGLNRTVESEASASGAAQVEGAITASTQLTAAGWLSWRGHETTTGAERRGLGGL